MIESGILAEGSVRGILNGTNYNRCKKLHSVAALSFKMLHFKAFLRKYEEKTDDGKKLYVNEIIEILENDNRNPGNIDQTLQLLNDLLQEYDIYTQETLNGNHGLTPQFVAYYVRFIELFQLFQYAIRSSDLDLYIYTAYRMCAIFFQFNHQNYARWLTRNLDDLINIKYTHPGLLEEFQNGALSIRRTAKDFCRSAVDLTLEQTINADAANKLKGITAFTNSLFARQRWSETHSVRTAIITHLLGSLHLVKLPENIEPKYQSKKFHQQLKTFSQEVCKNIDPFSEDINPSKLFNLTSGRAASQDTAEFLSSVELNGTNKMKMFIKECQEDINRFERPIKKNVIKSFATESSKMNRASQKHKDETKFERNILGKILCLAANNEIDLKNVLSHPLAAVPHSFAHYENIMNGCHKAGELTTLLMAKIERSHPLHMDNMDTEIDKIEVEIIDGFYLLSIVKDAPVKYGELAEFLLRKICNTDALEIHVIFDHHQSPSVKDIFMRKHKELYDNPSMNFKITGPNQERRLQMAKCLRSISFKEELVKFIIKFWSQNGIDTSNMKGKRVFVSFGGKCYVFSEEFAKGKILTMFENNHFETESKIILHMYKIRAAKIYIKTSNVDTMLVYLLFHMKFWRNDRQIWIETIDVSKNTSQVINVRQIHNILTSSMVNALPAWYTFTGCNYEPSFYNKGRKSCLKVLERNTDFQSVFGRMGNNDELQEEDITSLEGYTCQLYGSNSEDINQARYNVFQKAYGSFYTDFSEKGKRDQSMNLNFENRTKINIKKGSKFSFNKLFLNRNFLYIVFFIRKVF